MDGVKRPLLEIREALEEYGDLLPRGLSSRAGFYGAVRLGTVPTIRNGRRIYVVRQGLEALLRGGVQSDAS